MPIALLRVDDRLIHGRRVEGWLSVLRPGEIWVANDDASSDPLQKALLPMAVPAHVKTRIETVERAAHELTNSAAASARILVLVSNLADLKRLMAAGLKVESVNIGGLHYREDRREVMRFVFLNKEEMEFVSELGRAGVEVEARALPTDERVSLPDLIKGLK